MWIEEYQGCRDGTAQGQEQGLTLNPYTRYSWEVFLSYTL